MSTSSPIVDPAVGASNGAQPYWPLWIACFLGYAAIGMTIQVMPAFAQDRLGAGAVVSGLAVTIGSLATMIARPIAGRLADSRGGRGVVMAGAVLGIAGGIAHLVATTLPVLLLARLVLGAGEGALFTASIGWVLAEAPASRRGKVAGHFGLSMWTGLAIGPIIGAALLAAGSYRTVWVAASLLPLLAWLVLARTPRGPRGAEQADADFRRSVFPGAARVPAAANLLAAIGYGAIAAFLVPRFEALRLPGSSLPLAAFGVAFLTIRFFGSSAVDRFGARRVLVSAFCVEASGLAGLSVVQDSIPAFACTMLVGAGLSMLYPCLASLVTEGADPRERSAALGAVTSAWDLGVAAGGPLGGVVAGSAHAGAFAIGAAAALLAPLPILLGLRGTPRTVKPE